MKRAVIVSIILLLSMLSCQILTTKPTPDFEGNPSPQPAATELANYFLLDLSVGLDGLNSYTQTLSVSFTGTQAGQPLAFSDTYTAEVYRRTNTQFTYMAITDLEGVQSQMISGNAGEAYYSKSGDGECHVSWGQRAQGVEPFVITHLLPPLQTGVEAGSEEINGVQAQRYTFDAAALGYPSSTKAEGQVWLAVDGGYVVKYALRIQGEDALFGADTKGEQTYEYELEQIDALDGPRLPEGCPAVLTDFPATTDALDIERLPQILAYTSPADAAQVSAFYEEQLPPLGWTLSSTHPLFEEGKTLVFLHEQDSQISFITLQPAQGNTWVTVKVEPLAEAMPVMIP